MKTGWRTRAGSPERHKRVHPPTPSPPPPESHPTTLIPVSRRPLTMSITAQRFETISPTKSREQAHDSGDFLERLKICQNPKKKAESVGCQGENGTSADEDRHTGPGTDRNFLFSLTRPSPSQQLFPFFSYLRRLKI